MNIHWCPIVNLIFTLCDIRFPAELEVNFMDIEKHEIGFNILTHFDFILYTIGHFQLVFEYRVTNSRI